MSRVSILFPLAATLLPGASTMTVSSQSASQEQELVSIPAETDGIEVQGLIDKVHQILGFPILYDRKDVNGVVIHVAGDLKIARRNLLGTFEQLLDSVDMCVTEVADVGYQLHRLGPQAGRGAFLKTKARLLTEEELLQMESRTLLVTCSVELQRVLARDIVATLAPYF